MNPQRKATEHATPRKKKPGKIVEFPNPKSNVLFHNPKFDALVVAKLLQQWREKDAKRKYPKYIPTSDAARKRSVHVNSYIVGEHWRRRPSR